MVERLEAVHHRLADLRALHFVTLGFEPTLDPGDHPVDLVGGNVALARRVTDRARELVALERLALAGLLDHGEVAQLDPLECREARAACFALAPAADGGAVLAWPAVLYLAVFMGAERA